MYGVAWRGVAPPLRADSRAGEFSVGAGWAGWQLASDSMPAKRNEQRCHCCYTTTTTTRHHPTSILRDTLHNLYLHFTLSSCHIILILVNTTTCTTTIHSTPTPSDPDSTSLIDPESLPELSPFTSPPISLCPSMATASRVLPVYTLPSLRGTPCAHPPQFNMPLR
jgi:hypothetical protein